MNLRWGPRRGSLLQIESRAVWKHNGATVKRAQEQWLQDLEHSVTRRAFLKGVSASAALLATSSVAQAATATNAPVVVRTDSPLSLPPFLYRPTETSIRLTALSRKPVAEAALELRKDGKAKWERLQPLLKPEPHEALDWTV